MNIAVFAGGELWRLPEKQDWDMVICADSGCENALKFGIEPDLVVGDFDSISPETLDYLSKNNVKMIRPAMDQDKTDTQLAVEEGITLGASHIWIIGGMGRRLDQTLANIQLLLFLWEHEIPGCFTDGIQYVYLLAARLELVGESGDYVSILPLDRVLEGLCIKGLKYELDDYTLHMGDTKTVSNEFVGKSAVISVSKGIALAVIFRRSLKSLI